MEEKKTKDSDQELRELCGLAYGGKDTEGRDLWIGTDKQWDDYYKTISDM